MVPGSWADQRRSLFMDKQDKPELFVESVVKLTRVQMRKGTIFYKNETSTQWCKKNSSVSNLINTHLQQKSRDIHNHFSPEKYMCNLDPLGNVLDR